jgi:transposase
LSDMVNLNLNIQRLAISEVLRKLCVEDLDSLFSFGENGDQRCRTGLELVIQQVKQQHFPSTVVCCRTIRRWIHHYLKFGVTPIETVKWGKKHIKRKRESDWTEEISILLCSILEDHPEFYLDEIQDHLEMHGCFFSTTTIYDRMKELGYTLKVVYQKSAQRDEERRARWKSFMLRRGPEVAEQLIFVDETHKSIKDMRRRRHWVFKGKSQPFVESVFYGHERDIRYSMIGVCDIKGFVQEACHIVRTNGNEQDDDFGTIDRDRFEMWVEEKLLPVLGNYALGEPRSIVVMDNATIHTLSKARAPCYYTFLRIHRT